MATRNYLAIDLGAESGRAMLGRFNGERITLEEIHRFPNETVLLPEGLRWDAPRLFREALRSVDRARHASGRELHGVSVDAWGADFGLLDADVALLGLPAHYRDARTLGIPES